MLLGARDECAFYQAETQMLARENQMLRHRIRDLEKQLSDLHVHSNITHEPPNPSNLLTSQSAASEEAVTTSNPRTSESQATTTDRGKDQEPARAGNPPNVTDK